MGKWAPENRDVRMTPQGFQFPYGLMPKMASRLGDLAVVRSTQAWETVHSRGQYYLQTGHAVSPARIKEAPSLGSVIAYEAFQKRRATDFLPPFVSMNYEPSTMYGPLQGEGCLPADCSPLTLDLKDRNLPFVVDAKDRARFDRRWAMLNQMDTSRQTLNDSSPQGMRQFDSFGRAVRKMMTNPGISKVLEITPEGAPGLWRFAVWGRLFDCAEHGGGRRRGEVSPGNAARLGPSWGDLRQGRQGRFVQELSRSRCGLRGAAVGSSAAEVAGFDAGGLHG